MGTQADATTATPGLDMEVEWRNLTMTNKTDRNRTVTCDYEKCPYNREARCTDETLFIHQGQCTAYAKRSARMMVARKLVEDVRQGLQREL